MMKTVSKLILGLIAGIIIGFAIGGAITVLFTDKTFSQYFDGIMSLDGLETAAVAAAGCIFLLLSILILIPIHEAGHLVCGMLTEYKFVSFRIFDFTFIKIDGKIKIKRFSVAGTGGQCLLTPPDLPLEKIPTGWYNAGGVLANILVFLLVLPLFFLKLNPFLVEALVIFCLVDVIIILLNGIPMKLGGTSNDGYNIIYLNRNLLSKRSIVVQLRANAMIQNGTRPKDMPDEWFEWKTDIDYKNPLEVSIPLMHASRLIDEMHFEDAFKEFSELYSHKAEMMQLYINEIACELLFCSLYTGNIDLARELLTPTLEKYIEAYSKVMSSKKRILCAVALFMGHDREKALDIYQKLETDKDKYLLKGEVESDLAIMNRMLG